MDLHLKADGTLSSHRASRGKQRNERGAPPLVFTRRKYLVSAGAADFYIDSSPLPLQPLDRVLSSLAISMETFLRASRQREPISDGFSGSVGGGGEYREPELSDLSFDLRGRFPEQPSLPPRESSDRVMSLLVFSSRFSRPRLLPPLLAGES